MQNQEKEKNANMRNYRNLILSNKQIYVDMILRVLKENHHTFSSSLQCLVCLYLRFFY